MQLECSVLAVPDLWPLQYTRRSSIPLSPLPSSTPRRASVASLRQCSTLDAMVLSSHRTCPLLLLLQCSTLQLPLRSLCSCSASLLLPLLHYSALAAPVARSRRSGSSGTLATPVLSLPALHFCLPRALLLPLSPVAGSRQLALLSPRLCDLAVCVVSPL